MTSTTTNDYETLTPAARDCQSIYFCDVERSAWIEITNSDYKCSYRDEFFAKRGAQHDRLLAGWVADSSNPSRGNKDASAVDFNQLVDFMQAIFTNTAINW